MMNADHASDTTTIAAVATPVGIGGIGIIRISGDQSLPIACRLFRPSARKFGPVFSRCDRRSIPSHQLIHGFVVHPETSAPIDEVLLVWMEAPYSYTREDVVEIQSHSGYGVLHTLLSLILKMGSRQAEPGEFTRRAFLNGRIDLTQAEAVIDLIHAQNEQLVGSAASQLREGIGQHLAPIRHHLLQMAATIEARIDFPDDVPDETDSFRKEFIEGIEQNLIQPCRHLLNQYDSYHHFRDGLRITIIGRPNVGKSSLMNFLLGHDRAIVTELPGTTRDCIEDRCRIQGIDVVMVDTAGIHDTEDRIEKAGILRSYEQINRADIVLFVTDASDPFTTGDQKLLSRFHQPALIVVNKIDLLPEDHPILRQTTYGSFPVLPVSIRNKLHTEKLPEQIWKQMEGHFSQNHPMALIPNLRHRHCLERMVGHFQAAQSALSFGMTLDGVAIDLRDAVLVLGELTGERYTEEILSSIFESFCIGK